MSSMKVPFIGNDEQALKTVEMLKEQYEFTEWEHCKGDVKTDFGMIDYILVKDFTGK